MKKNKLNIIMFLLFFVGFSLLMYPFISNFVNQKIGADAIVDYETILKNNDNNHKNKLLNEADAYNKKLSNLDNPLITHVTLDNYDKILNLDNNGMIGYIKINKIKVELPIYHGTSKEVLSKAVGHLEGSSLPVGGLGTHSVLSAHRGLPSATLFTNLDKLEVGDTFVIKVLDKELNYQVDKIQIVNPSDVKTLKIEKNKDYVTLMTCTPYGINTHRLLVRGERVETKSEIFITTEAFKVSKTMVTLFILIPVITVLLIIVMFKPISINKNKIKDKYIYPSKNK